VPAGYKAEIFWHKRHVDIIRWDLLGLGCAVGKVVSEPCAHVADRWVVVGDWLAAAEMASCRASHAGGVAWVSLADHVEDVVVRRVVGRGGAVILIGDKNDGEVGVGT
jgi:hypothetical protein